jgi:hypothetical protein
LVEPELGDHVTYLLVALVNKVDQLTAELEETTVELEATKRREQKVQPSLEDMMNTLSFQ